MATELKYNWNSRFNKKTYSSSLPPLPRNNYSSFVESHQQKLSQIQHEIRYSETQSKISLPLINSAYASQKILPFQHQKPYVPGYLDEYELFGPQSANSDRLLKSYFPPNPTYNVQPSNMSLPSSSSRYIHPNAYIEEAQYARPKFTTPPSAPIHQIQLESMPNIEPQSSFSQTKANYTQLKYAAPKQGKQSKWDTTTQAKPRARIARSSNPSSANLSRKIWKRDATLLIKGTPGNEFIGKFEKKDSGVNFEVPEAAVSGIASGCQDPIAQSQTNGHVFALKSSYNSGTSISISDTQESTALPSNQQSPNIAEHPIRESSNHPPKHALEIPFSAPQQQSAVLSSNQTFALNSGASVEASDSQTQRLGTQNLAHTTAAHISNNQNSELEAQRHRQLVANLQRTLETLVTIKGTVSTANIMDSSAGAAVANAVCEPLIQHIQSLLQASRSTFDSSLLETFGASIRSFALAKYLENNSKLHNETVATVNDQPQTSLHNTDRSSGQIVSEPIVSEQSHYREINQMSTVAKQNSGNIIAPQPPSPSTKPVFIRKSMAKSASGSGKAHQSVAKSRSSIWSADQNKVSINLDQLMPPKPIKPESADFAFCGFSGPTASSIRALDVLEIEETGEVVAATAGTDNLPQSSDRTISVWLLRKGSASTYDASELDGNMPRIRVLDNGTSKSVLTLAFSKAHTWLLLSSDLEFDVKLWNWRTGQCLKVWKKLHTRIIHKTMFVPHCPTRVASCSADQSIKFAWINDEFTTSAAASTENGPIVESHLTSLGVVPASRSKLVQSVNANEPFTSFTFAGGDIQGQTLIASLSYTIRIYKMRTMQLLHTINFPELKQNATPITTIHSHPHFDNYVLLSTDNQVHLFDLSSETTLRTFVARELLPGIRIEGKFSPCGTFVYSNSSDVKSLSTRQYQQQKQKQQQWMLENAQLMSSSTLSDASGIFLWRLHSSRLARSEMRAMNNSVPKIAYVNGQPQFPSTTLRNVICACWVASSKSSHKFLVTASTDNMIRMFMYNTFS